MGLINCELPMMPDRTPVKVSLVDLNSTSASNVLDIVDLKTRMEKFQRSSSVVNFTICTSPLYGNKMSASDLVEFIEINRIFWSAEIHFLLGVGE